MEPDDKSVIIFGRDISKIPCFRNTFLYSISGGIACGLAYFMFTSKPRIATHVGVASFALITMGYWTQCRYNYSKTKFEMMRVQRILRERAMFEGTAYEKELEEKIKSESVDV